MAKSDEVRLDASGLRALAHPLRVRLVGLLRRHGPSTATRLAERLAINSGSASYHLRKLADAGFVEELTDRGNARERWWAAAHRMTRFSDRELADREPEATRVYLQSVVDTYALRARQAVDEVETLPVAWRGAFELSDWGLRITPAEAIALREELTAVVQRYRQEGSGDAEDAGGPAGAGTVSVILQILPDLQDTDAFPEPEPEPDTAGPEVEGSEGAEGSRAPEER